jgi:hypothetical protein
MQTLTTVDLWGGSMTCALPEVFKDISLIKPVPDHQEMWFWGETGTLIILELCQEVEGHDPIELSKMHWVEIAMVNDSAWNQVVEASVFDHQCIPNLPPEHVPWVAMCDGVQAIVKRVPRQEAAAAASLSHEAAGGADALLGETMESLHVGDASSVPASQPQIVQVVAAIVPLANVQTHMVISVTRPLQVLDDSGAAEERASCDENDSVSVGLDAMMKPLLFAVLSSLRIHNWELFG